ncbi:MAG: hypothetical protein H7Z75_06590, partial [Ferruginibacter sp.]|nr:hypothetical protein [Cytophagales bacterium]
HGQSIADEVERLLATSLSPLTAPPVGRLRKIELPFDHVPDVKELIALSKEEGAKGHNAGVHLERVVRGMALPTSLTYPIQTWTFGNKLALVFLGGEVVADYSLRLKKELGAERLWVNAYANDVKAYIPSRRIIPQGGYEVEGNMYYYDHPFRFSEAIEDMIVGTVHALLPAAFEPKAASRTTGR